MNPFIAPFVNALFGSYYLVGNLGLSIIVVTLLIRLILLPLVLPSLKSARKMQELQPELKKLQDKYGKNKTALATAQMELYKQKGVNPLSGCLPNILQIVVLMLFFSAFNMVSGYADGKVTAENINKQLITSFQVKEDFRFSDSFLGVKLSETPMKIVKGGMGVNWILPLVLLLGSAYLQYWTAKRMLPAPVPSKRDSGVAKPANDTAYTKLTPGDGDDMMAAMRTQSTYMMPMMTLLIGLNFSIGILIYWFVNSLTMAGQQLIMAKSEAKK